MLGQILIIDDNPVDVKIAVSAIERTGFACFGFTDHTQAITWLDTNVPQMILLDLQMPNITGYQVIPFLRALPNSAAVPIIIISGKNQSDDILKAIKLGANDYIVKPLDPLVLQEKVAKTTVKLGSEFHSVDIAEADEIRALISRPTKILSLSEFGLKLGCEIKIAVGDTFELTGLAVEQFGKDRLLVRCLTCEAVSGDLFVCQVTYVGMVESQRQVIRQTCRKLWIKGKGEAA